MKTRHWIVLGLVLACFGPGTDAQEIPPFEEPMDGPGHEPPPHEMMGQPGPGPGPGHGPEHAVDRWLERLREEDPAEYERLVRLREKDPQTFHEELRARLRLLRMARNNPRHRKLLDRYRQMPPNERKAFMEEIWSRKPRPQRKGTPIRTTPELEELAEETRTLVETYKSAETDEARAAAREQLHAHLYKVFDERSEAREEMIAAMERKLEDLKEKVDQRIAHRDTIVERRLEELTEGEHLEW